MRTTLLLFFSGLLLGAGCGEVREGRVLKLAHGLSTIHPVHVAMAYLANRLDTISGGKLQIDIYPSEQLGRERECLELLQIGSIAITKVSAGVFENFAPNIEVVGLPYIWRSREHQYTVFDGPIGKRLLEEPMQYGLLGLCFFDAGFRSFYTKEKPIMKPEDLHGMKIRVMPSKTAADLIETLGASANPIPWGELYSALQQGVVDGAENNPPSFVDSKHYEICKFYALNEHTALPDVLVMSKLWWDRLNEQEQAWLKQAVAEAIPYQREVWLKSEAACLQLVQDNGVTVVRPDKSSFMTKLAGTFDTYRERPEIYQLIQDIQAVKAPSDSL